MLEAITFDLSGAPALDDQNPYGVFNTSILIDELNRERLSSEVVALAAMPDEALIFENRKRFSIIDTSLMESLDLKNYTWTKINHAWWELSASRGQTNSGIDKSIFSNNTWFETSRCCDIIAKSLCLFKSCTNPAETDSPIDELNFSTDQGALAISFNAGHLWNRDISTPLPPYIRGAMIGAGPFFNAALGSTARHRVLDGAAAKKLAYQGQLADFCAATRAWSDLVVFITPEHLSRIRLLDYAGPMLNITVPSKKIHELWPMTLCHVAGLMEEPVKMAGNMTVFIQAAVVSAPICALIQAMAQENPNLNVRTYDFGQVLDLAEPIGGRTKKWARDLESFPQYANAHRGSFTLAEAP